MRPILRVEIIPAAEYQAARAWIRAKVIDQKRKRRVKLGEHMSALFENSASVRLQIQEMLFAENITGERAIQHELAVYNALVPGDRELSVTLFVEVPEREKRDRMLVELAGLEEHVAIEVDGRSYRFAGKRDSASPHRTSAVHYLKAKLSPEAVRAFASRKARAALVVDHPKRPVRTELTKDAIDELAEDFENS